MRAYVRTRAGTARCLAGLAVALVLALASRVGAATGPVIVYPPDQALLSGDGAVDVLGFLPGAGPGSLTIIAKSGSRSQPVSNGSFSVKVTLEAGVNSLVLQDRKVTVFLSGGAAVAIPPGYSPPDTHAVENSCEDCHSFAGGAAALLKKPPSLCDGCHDDVLKDKNGKPQTVLHPPAQEGDCLACHPFHKLSLKKLPAAAKRDLCFGCHDDFTNGGKKRMHRPVAQGDCTGCHGAHGAAEKKLLPATGLKLCLLCHADPAKNKEGKAYAVAHPALDDGCASCHLAHVSEAPRLLKKAAVELCGDCHDPFPTQQDGRKLVRHSPVEEGECVGCHRVHGSDVGKLLAASGKALCLNCHDDPSMAPGGKEWTTAHPALDDGCGSCHPPHVAPAARMLKKAQPGLCYDCHDAFVRPPPRTGGSIHAPVADGTCSRCHAPHGSATKKLLVAPPERQLCLACHKDPTLAPTGGPWEVQHPAIEDGCPTCHVPHVSASPRLVAKPQRELCAGCHEDKNRNGEGAVWAVPHTPVANGMCGSCHGVHGSPEKALLKKSPYEICQTCHTEVHQRHQVVDIDPATGEVVTSTDVRLPSGFPLRKKDGRLACVGCHLPHGSDNRLLWTANESVFCSGCHPM